MAKKPDGITLADLIAGQQNTKTKMNAAVEAQLKSILAQEKLAKLDEKLQVIQTAESIRSEKDESLSAKELKSGLLDKTGDGANANIIKMLAEIKKSNGFLKKQNEANAVLGKVGDRREFKTIGQRLSGVKDNVKDFFTMRGFLDKTGIVKRGSGGIFGEALDAREDRQKYARARIAAGDPTVNLHGKEGARKIFERQRGEQQQLVRDTNKNDAKLSEYKRLNISDRQIGLSPETKAKVGLAARWQKVDPSVRTNSNDMSESEIEQARAVEEQTNVLNKIEENTRPLESSSMSSDAEKESKGGLIDKIMPGLGIAAALTSLATVFSAIKTVIKKIALPVAIIMSLYDGIIAAIEGYEQNGIMGAAEGFITGALNSVVGSLLDLVKNVAAWIVGALGFDKAKEFLDSFSFTDIIKDFVHHLFRGIGLVKDMVLKLTDFISSIKIPKFKIFGMEFGGDDSTNYKSNQKIASPTPSTANKVYNESAKVDAANKQPQVAQKQSTVVSAPTQINNSTQNAVFRPTVRNNDNTVNSYFKSRFA